MSKRTRLFLGIAAGVLVLGLGTGLVASYMGLQTLTIIGGNPDEYTYLPSDARVVAYANVRDVMDSEMRQKLQQFQPRTDDGRAKVEAATGVNIERDIDQVFAAMSDMGGNLEQHRPLLLVRGRFDEVKIEGLDRDQGGSVEEYKGERLLVHPGANLAVAFVEPGLVAVGTAASVRRAIDTKSSGAGGLTDNADLMRLLHEVNDGNAWAVARFDALAASAQLPPAVASRLPPIAWFAASGHINGGIRGSLRAEARDENGARDLRDVMRGFIALARMQTGQRQDLADLMNSLELGGEGKTVSLGFSVPSETIEALGSLRAGRGRPPGPNPR